MIAKVSIDRNASSLNDLYDYIIPESLEDKVEVGCSVIVSFGFDKVTGYVYDIVSETNSTYTLKEILEVKNKASDFGKENFLLADYLSKELNCTFGNVYSLMLPSFMKGDKKKYLYVLNYDNLDANLAGALNGRTKLEYTDEISAYKNIIDKEVKCGNIEIGYDFSYYGKSKFTKVFSANNQSIQSTAIRNAVLNYVFKHPECTLDQIRIATNASTNIVKALVDNGSISYKEVLLREEAINLPHSIAKNISFSFEEEDLYSSYKLADTKRPLLLVTDNDEFKINLYLRILENCYSIGKKCVIVTPSIFKAEELYIKLKRFARGYNILLYHSKCGVSSNFDVYESIKNNDFDLLITVLGGLFLPYKNVETIIMEDSEDTNYVSESYPYFSSEVVLRKKASLLGAKLIISSVSPTVEEYYLAKNGEYILLENIKEVNKNVTLVDMSKELIEESNTIISSSLQNKISDSIAHNHISLLVCNNLSFSTQVRCRKCGTILKCPHCNLPLSYSKKKDEVRCAYCGYKKESFDVCKCGNTNFISFGFGIEKVTEKVKELFPNARIMEFSSNTLSSVDDMNNVIAAVEEASVDIIIGTNAVLNILPYDNIDNVGLLYVDSFLNASNYLGSEQAYALIRKSMKYPSVTIQTYHSDNYVINSALNGNSKNFYDMQLIERETLNYPPYKNFSIISVKGDYNEIFHFGNYFKKAVSYNKDMEVLGPSYDYGSKGVKLIVKYNDFNKLVKSVNDSVTYFKSNKITLVIKRYTRGA